jgi:hypothetical protein
LLLRHVKKCERDGVSMDAASRIAWSSGGISRRKFDVRIKKLIVIDELGESRELKGRGREQRNWAPNQEFFYHRPEQRSAGEIEL